MMNRLLPLATIIVLLPVFTNSCLDEPPIRELEEGLLLKTKSLDSVEIHPIFGRRLTNAYSLRIMQLAYDSLCVLYNLEPQTVPPTDLYVRFLPKDSTELNYLYSQNFDLFDYPLDYENEPEDSFHDPSVPDSLITWQYTTIPSGMTIPDSLVYEIIDTCYIPIYGSIPTFSNRPPEESRRLLNHSNLPVELLLDILANQIAGQQDNGGEPIAFINNGSDLISSVHYYYPNGTISVKKNDSTNIGLKGVQIRVRNGVKTSSTCTNSSGYYSIPMSFTNNVRYSIKYKNIKKFWVLGTIFVTTPCWKNLGKHSSSGFTYNIEKSDSHWLCSVINNSVYDYYTLCEQDGRFAPVDDLRVSAISNAECNMCPMFHHLGYQNFVQYSSNEMGRELIDIMGIGITQSIILGLNYGFSDVAIYDWQGLKDYNTLDETTYHELSHASHFAASGTSIWYPLMVFNVITGSDGYGDGTVNDYIHRIGELSEAWGFANERIRHKHNRGSIGYAGYSFTWLQPSIESLYELIDENVLTEKQILQRMTPTTTSIDILHSRLQQSYPNKAARIGFIFASHNALTWQTKWTLHNATGTTLNLVLRKGTYTREFNLYNNDSCLYLALPWDEESFYSIKNTYTDYYPDEITILNGVDTVFHEINRVPTHLMHSPLFYVADWTCQTTYTPVGDTHIREFSHTLYSL